MKNFSRHHEKFLQLMKVNWKSAAEVCWLWSVKGIQIPQEPLRKGTKRTWRMRKMHSCPSLQYWLNISQDFFFPFIHLRLWRHQHQHLSPKTWDYGGITIWCHWHLPEISHINIIHNFWDKEKTVMQVYHEREKFVRYTESSLREKNDYNWKYFR